MIIHSKRIVFKDGIRPGYLVIEDGKFTKICEESENLKADIDAKENRIIPGIIDTHNHGGFGCRMRADIDEEEMKLFLKGCASFGVTGVFPTASSERDYLAYPLLVKMADEFQDGAQVLGIHSEGPWGARVGEKGINNGYPTVKMEIAQKMVEYGQGKLKLVGIAPEVENAHEAIRYFKDHGVTVAAYHTNANYEEANAGIDAGITVATHLGNVMTGLHHRDVGTCGACLLRDEVTCEIICDGFHVSLPMIKIMLKVKDHDKIIMVSDNVQYAGAPVGHYRTMHEADKTSDRKVLTVTEEGFVLSETGRISGSSKPVLYGMGNLVEKLGMDLVEVSKFSSYNPSVKYGFPNKGSIEIGKDADFVIISDDYKALMTFCQGKKVFDAQTETVVFNPEFIKKYKID